MCRPSDLLSFLFSYFSKYLCLFVFIPCPPSLSLRRGGRGGFLHPYLLRHRRSERFRFSSERRMNLFPLFSFLFSLSYFLFPISDSGHCDIFDETGKPGFQCKNKYHILSGADTPNSVRPFRITFWIASTR